MPAQQGLLDTSSGADPRIFSISVQSKGGGNQQSDEGYMGG